MFDLDQQIRAEISRIVTHPTSTYGTLRLADALRQILDLHQPAWGLEHAEVTCPVCAGDYPDGPYLSVPYPCPTVQAIATQLGLTQETTP